MKYTKLLLLILFSLFIQFSYSNQKQKNEIDEIRISFLNSSSPYYFKNINDQADGLFIDLFELWSKKINIPVSYFFDQNEKKEKNLNNEDLFDLYVGMNNLSENNQTFNYLTTVFNSSNNIFINNSLKNITDLQTLLPFQIGAVKDSSSSKFLLNEFSNTNNIRIFNSYDNLMKALKNNEIMVFISDEIKANYYLNKHQLQNEYYYSSKQVLFENAHNIAIKNNNIELSKIILNGLNRISDSEKKALIDKWNLVAIGATDDILTIAIPEDYKPFSNIDRGDSLEGFLVDFWNIWSKKTGKKIRLTPYQSGLTPSALSRIEADIYSGFLLQDSGRSKIELSNPIYKTEVGIFVKKNNYYTNFVDLENIRLGVIENTFNSNYLIKQFPNISTIEFSNLNSLHRAFLNNTIDGIFHDEIIIKELFADKLGTEFFQLESFKFTKSLFAGVHSENNQLLNTINTGINSISQKELTEIEDKWIPHLDGRIYSNFTNEEKDWLNKNSSITIGVLKDYFPFEYISRNNALQGTSINFIKKILANIGLKYEYKFIEKYNLNNKLENGEIDLILSHAAFDNKDNTNFTEHTISEPAIVALNPYIISINSLNGKKVVVEKDSDFYYYISNNFPEINLKTVSTLAEGFEQVLNEEADAFIENYNYLNNLKDDNEFQNISVNKIEGLPEINIGFLTSSKDKTLKNLIEKQLNLISFKEKNEILTKLLNEKPYNQKIHLSLDELNWLQKNSFINIAILKNNPPFSFYKNNFFQGLIIDYLTSIETKLNINFNFIPVGSYDEVYSNSNVNFIAEFPINKTYSSEFESSKFYSRSKLMIITKEGEQKISSLKSQKNKKIIIPEAYSIEREIVRKYPLLTIISINDAELGLQMIEENKADMMLIDRATFDYFMKNNLRVFSQNKFNDFTYDLALGFRKNANIDAAIFEKALSDISPLEKEGLERKWLNKNPNIEDEKKYLTRTISFVIALSILILIAIIFWNKRLKKEIKNRKNVEANLLKLSQAIEQSPSAVLITDFDFEIEYTNESFTVLTGYNFTDIIGKKPYFLKSYDEIKLTLNKGIVWTKDKKIDTSENKEIWVRINVSPIYSKDIISHFVMNIYDITEQKKIEETRMHQAELEKLFADISTHLIIHSMKEIDSEIEYGLKKICEFSRVDRGYLFLISPDKRIIYNTHEWRAEGVKSQIDTLKGLFPFPWFMDQLNSFKNIHIPSVANLEEESGIVREVLLKENIKSQLFVPIRYSHELLGFVGFDTIKEEKIWTKEDIAVLKIFGDIFANAIARKNIENKLKEAKQKADLANKAKSHFLANMSHEIRTPMNAILGITHLLSQTILNKKQKDYVEKVRQSSNNLLNIINDILDFSKIEAGKIEFESIEFNLNKVLENLANVISVKAQNKDIEVIIRKSPEVPEYLIGDSLRLGQILLNLVSNSVKFTEKGEVLISIDLEKETQENITLSFSIKDTGIGIDKEKLATLFESFIQADTSTTRKYGGTGLGLSISKKLVEMMSGTISAESTVGEGSSFNFTAEFRRSNRVKTDYILPSIDLRNMSALIVDNNITAAETLKLYLESFTFNVDIADSRSKAYKQVQDKSYKIVLIASECSAKSGEKFINSFKEILPLHNDTKFILTEKYSQESFIDLKNSSFDDIILKPITQSAIFNSIINILGIEAPEFRKNQEEKLHESIEFIKGAKILLVEDNEINQQVAIEILQKKGFWVDIANNGQKAVDKLVDFNSAKYDIILMDLQMPVLDGYKATKVIREELHLLEIPIIAMTADALKGVEKQCIEAGMNDYVSKPIIPDTLFKKLHKWIKKDSDMEILIDSPNSTLTLNAHLDIHEGIHRIGDNKSLYLSLINKFYHNNLGLTASINKLFHDNESDKLTRIIHTLKGVSGNISANILHNLCLEAEVALKDDFGKSEKTLIEVNKELNVVLNDIKTILSKEENQLTSSDEYSQQELEHLFEKLIKLLNEDDIDALDFFEKILSKVKSQPFYNDLNNLKSFVHNYEFEQAITELNIFFKKHNLLKGE